MLGNTSMVPPVLSDGYNTTNQATCCQGHIAPDDRPTTGASTLPKAAAYGRSVIRTALISRANVQLEENTLTIIEASYRDSTCTQYSGYIRRFKDFCHANTIDHIRASVSHGLKFLTMLYHSGLGYSGINTARSALSSVIILKDGITFGKHPLVCRFMKGVFQLRPSLPRYTTTWDINIVLTWCKTLPLALIKLTPLTHKLTVLLALLTSQRVQTLQAITLQSLHIDENCVTIYVNKLLKTSRPGTHLGPITLQAYTDMDLCVVKHMAVYLHKTALHRPNECDQLLITTQKPYKAASRDTISHWIKNSLTKAGVDTDTFSAHSTRSASSSAKLTAGIPVERILHSAGWSSSSTFEKFYKKTINSVPPICIKDIMPS